MWQEFRVHLGVMACGTRESLIRSTAPSVLQRHWRWRRQGGRRPARLSFVAVREMKTGLCVHLLLANFDKTALRSTESKAVT